MDKPGEQPGDCGCITSRRKTSAFGLGRRPRPRTGDQDLNVLYGAWEQLLDLHTPQSAPPGSVVPVALPASERTFHQMLAGWDIPSSCRAAPFLPLLVDVFLAFVTTGVPPAFGIGALST